MQISLSTWKKVIDLHIRVSSSQMFVNPFIYLLELQELLKWAEVSRSVESIQGMVLYTEEVFLKNKHPIRHRASSQEGVIASKIQEVVKMIVLYCS